MPLQDRSREASHTPMPIATPYLLFLGDVPDALAAKTAYGVVDWRREWCVGHLRLPGCRIGEIFGGP